MEADADDFAKCEDQRVAEALDEDFLDALGGDADVPPAKDAAEADADPFAEAGKDRGFTRYLPSLPPQTPQIRSPKNGFLRSSILEVSKNAKIRSSFSARRP